MNQDIMNAAKKQSLRLSHAYQNWGLRLNSDSILNRASRVMACSDVWVGMICPSCGKLHGMRSHGCHDRLCPICAAKLARASAFQAQQAVELMRKSRAELRWAMITLTQKNVPSEQLSAEIGNIIEAWAALRHVRQIERGMIGWARSIEITYNRKQGTFHPHMHIIIAFSDEAFLRSDFWAQTWRSCMGLNYAPVCDARPVQDDGAVREISKYVLKVSSIFRLPRPAFETVACTIAEAIHGRRLKSYGGIWLKARRALKQKDEEEMSDAELDALEDISAYTCPCGTSEPLQPYAMRWAGFEYKEVSI